MTDALVGGGQVRDVRGRTAAPTTSGGSGERRTPRPTPRRAWTLAADAVVLLPLGAALTARATRHDTWLTGLSVALGLLATSALVIVVVLVSRIGSLSRALGIERVGRLHRLAGTSAVGLALAHVVVAVPTTPHRLAVLVPTAAGGAARAGIGATVVLLVLTTLVVPRRGRPGHARRTRRHALLTAVALVLVGVHVGMLRRLVTEPLPAAVLVALAVVVLLVFARRWVWRPLLDRGAHVVVGLRPESTGTTTVVLAPTHLRHALRPEPGQFVWMRLRRGAALADEHPFTVAAAGSTRLELTVRHGGAFTQSLRLLEPGRPVWLDGPHGAFTPTPAADGLVLVAGGIGVTPMMCMLRARAAATDRRPHRLLLAERPGEQLFPVELDALSRRLDLVVTRTGGRRLDPAVLAEVVPARDPGSHDYFVCGSPSLVEAALAALAVLDVPGARVHTERF